MSDRLVAAVVELIAALRAELGTAQPLQSAAVLDDPTLLLSVAQAAKRLNLGPSKVYELIASGRLRSVRIGRRRLVPAGAVVELIASSLSGRGDW
jgi:excisionase family DNA binding protein